MLPLSAPLESGRVAYIDTQDRLPACLQDLAQFDQVQPVERHVLQAPASFFAVYFVHIL